MRAVADAAGADGLGEPLKLLRLARGPGLYGGLAGDGLQKLRAGRGYVRRARGGQGLRGLLERGGGRLGREARGRGAQDIGPVPEGLILKAQGGEGPGVRVQRGGGPGGGAKRPPE